MPLKTYPFDVADFLKTERHIEGYLSVVFEEGDAEMIQIALGNVARARGMAKIAAGSGLGRNSLYKALSKDGNPSLSTVARVLGTMGLKLTVSRHKPKKRPAAKRTKARAA